MAGKTQSRHAGRKRALDILYEADLVDRSIGETLVKHLDDPEEPPGDFAVALVRGVHRHRADLDDLITTHSREWKLSRMPVVDRNVLRLALFEILHTDVPAAVAIDEAVELAKELSTSDSPRFINGVLAKIAANPPAPPSASPTAPAPE